MSHWQKKHRNHWKQQNTNNKIQQIPTTKLNKTKPYKTQQQIETTKQTRTKLKVDRFFNRGTSSQGILYHWCQSWINFVTILVSSRAAKKLPPPDISFKWSFCKGARSDNDTNLEHCIFTSQQLPKPPKTMSQLANVHLQASDVKGFKFQILPGLSWSHFHGRTWDGQDCVI